MARKARIPFGLLALARRRFPLAFGPVATYRCHMCKGVTRTDVRPRDVMGRLLAPPAGPRLGRATGVYPRHPRGSPILLAWVFAPLSSSSTKMTSPSPLPSMVLTMPAAHADVGDTGAHGMEEVCPRDAAPTTPAMPVGRGHFIQEVRPLRVQESRPNSSRPSR